MGVGRRGFLGALLVTPFLWRVKPIRIRKAGDHRGCHARGIQGA